MYLLLMQSLDRARDRVSIHANSQWGSCSSTWLDGVFVKIIPLYNCLQIHIKCIVSWSCHCGILTCRYQCILRQSMHIHERIWKVGQHFPAFHDYQQRPIVWHLNFRFLCLFRIGRYSSGNSETENSRRRKWPSILMY